MADVVGEHSILHRRCGVSQAGVDGKEDVGISNDKESEKLSHRKSKVS